MNYKIELDHDLKFVRYTHTGIMTLEEIGDAWREMLGMEEFTQGGYHILTDYRGGIYDFSIERLENIDDFLYKIKDVLDGKKNAVLTDRPDELAITMLVGNKKDREMNYHVKLFTTEKEALAFLRE